MRDSAHRPVAAMLALALPLILIACGGGGAAPTTGARATGTPGSLVAATPPPISGPTTPPVVAPTIPPVVAPTGASGSVDVCALLPIAEVAAAYGEPLEGAVANSDEQYWYCTYGEDREVRAWLSKHPDVALMIFNTMKINDGEAVTGVGDEAWWSTDSFQPGLYFMKGGLLAFISGSEYGPEAPIIELGKVFATRF